MAASNVSPVHAEPWTSVEQVAQHIGVAKDTVYRWREHKGLPAHRIGRLWKFKLTEVDQWVMAGGAAEEVPSTPTPTPAALATTQTENGASHGNP